MGLRDKIRARAASSRNLKTEIVTVELDGEPTDILVREPNIEEMEAIEKRKGDFPEGSLAAGLESNIEAAIRCCYDPEDPGTRIWDHKDAPILRKHSGPAGFVNTLSTVVAKLMTPPSKEDAEKAKGECGPTH